MIVELFGMIMHDGAVGFDPKFRSENRKPAEQNSDQELPDGIGKLADGFCLLDSFYSEACMMKSSI